MKWLSIFLAFGLLCAPLSALPSPPPSSPSVTLSPEEAAQIEAAILQAQEALKRSNEEIARLQKLSTTLWIFSGALVAATVLDAVAHIIVASK